jgi:hypothetical protein
MKVFIVTSGARNSDYRSYSIERVFLDESKASQYSDRTWDSRVEEYQTSDDMIDGIRGHHEIEATYGPDSHGQYKSHVRSKFIETGKGELLPNNIECSLVKIHSAELPKLRILQTIPYTQLIVDREARFKAMAVELFGKLDAFIKIDGLSFEAAKKKIEKWKVIDD